MPLIIPVDFVTGMELNAGDGLFIRENGPHLGYRSHRNDVVLVHVPNVRDPNADVDLYAALLKAGAKVVADPRPMTGPEDAAAIVQGLGEIPGASGHVFRNIQLSASSGALTDEQKTGFVGGDIIYTDAAFDINHHLRYYPMLWVDGDARTDETLVIKAARVALGSAPVINPVVVARDSGVLGVWARLGLAPSQVTGPLKEAQNVRPRPYPLSAGNSVTWIVHPSRDLPAQVSPAAVWINYRSQQGQYKRYEAADVISGKVSERPLKGKVVIVDGSPALFDSPTAARQITWAEADAQTLEGILDAAYMVPEGMEALVGVIALSLIGSVVFALIDPKGALSVTVVALATYLVVSVIAYRSGLFPDLVLAPAALVSSSLLSGAGHHLHKVAERRRIFGLFGLDVPEKAANDALRGSKREVTLLFADLRGVATLAEQGRPQDALKQLNTFLQRIRQAADDEQGTVHEYGGAAAMVLFNAPLDQPDHRERALRTALKMQAAMGTGSVAAGIGIHTGEAVVGAVGAHEREEFVAIGPAVDLALGLSEAAGRGEIVISEDLRLALSDEVEAEARAPITIRGVGGGLATYRVIGARET
jgi:adenylate cyclase